MLEEIHAKDDHMGVGVLGGRVIFRVLCDFGYEDLAIKMITRPDQPSYGCMIADGLTTLGETPRPPYSSLNHHFWGDISSWYVKTILGIRVNPFEENVNNINIEPHFIESLDFAEGWYDTLCGKLSVKWERVGGDVKLTVDCPEGIVGHIKLPFGFKTNDRYVLELKSGEYIASKVY